MLFKHKYIDQSVRLTLQDFLQTYNDPTSNFRRSATFRQFFAPLRGQQPRFLFPLDVADACRIHRRYSWRFETGA